jgi:hypothetical protein
MAHQLQSLAEQLLELDNYLVEVITSQVVEEEEQTRVVCLMVMALAD